MSLVSQQPMSRLHQVWLESIIMLLLYYYKYIGHLHVTTSVENYKIIILQVFEVCELLTGNIDILKLLSQKYKKLMTLEAADGEQTYFKDHFL